MVKQNFLALVLALTLFGVGCNPPNTSPTLSPTSSPKTATTTAEMTIQDTLNSGGFIVGRRSTSDDGSVPFERITTSTITIADLDNDGIKEGVAGTYWCATDVNCGADVLIFKTIDGEIKTFTLTEYNRSGTGLSQDTLKNISVNNGVITVIRTSGATKKDFTDTYRVSFAGNTLQVVDGKTGEPVEVATYRHDNPEFSFNYPLYYEQNPVCRLTTDPVWSAADWTAHFGDNIIVSIKKISATTTLAMDIKNLEIYSAPVSQKDTSIAGLPGIIAEYEEYEVVSGLIQHVTRAFFKKSSQLFTVTVPTSDKPRCERDTTAVRASFNRILSTFAF